MEKMLLVLGASFEHVPIVRAARAAGLRIITVDPEATAPAHARADQSFYCDPADTAAVLHLASDLGVNGVLSISDETLPAANAVATHLNSPSAVPEQSLAPIRSRIAFRDLITGIGLPHPQTHLLDESSAMPEGIFENARWILKPETSSGCRGVFVIRSYAEFQQYLPISIAQSATRKALLERYESERHYVLTCILADGRFQQGAVIDRFEVDAPCVVPASFRMPSILPLNLRRSAATQVEQICAAMKISSGIITADFVTADTKLHVMSVSPRLPGYGLAQLIALSSGVDLISAAIALALGEKPVINATPEQRAWALVLLGTSSDGKLSFDATVAEKLASENWIRDLAWRKPLGSDVRQYTTSDMAVGRALVTGRDRGAVDALCGELLRRLKLQAV